MTQETQEIRVNLDEHKVTRDSKLYVAVIKVSLSAPRKKPTEEILEGTFDLVTNKFVFSNDSLSTLRRWGDMNGIESSLVYEAIITATDQVTEGLEKLYKVQS
jgi:hypothetical protein